jgi:ribosome-binding protein aMBF1 (putative translation factor)
MRPDRDLSRLTKIAKVAVATADPPERPIETEQDMSPESTSPIGDHHATARRRRLRDPEYLSEAQRLAPFEALARMVIRFRMDRGLSQEQLADLIGSSYSAISRLESGTHRPNVETLQKLARAFDRQLVIGFTEPLEPTAEQEPIVARVGHRDAALVALP